MAAPFARKAQRFLFCRAVWHRGRRGCLGGRSPVAPPHLRQLRHRPAFSKWPPPAARAAQARSQGAAHTSPKTAQSAARLSSQICHWEWRCKSLKYQESCDVWPQLKPRLGAVCRVFLCAARTEGAKKRTPSGNRHGLRAPHRRGAKWQRANRPPPPPPSPNTFAQ